MEDFSRVYDSKLSRSALQVAERLCLARSESHEDRIPAASRQTMGVSFLSGLYRPCRCAGLPQRAAPPGRARRYAACFGLLPARRLVKYPTEPLGHLYGYA